jgi:hypothetical protein
MNDRASLRSKVARRLRRTARPEETVHTEPQNSPEPVAELPAPRPRRAELTVAVAAGERLRTGLSWEWRQVDLNPAGWRALVSAERPEFVLVELARDGVPGWDPSALGELVGWSTAEEVPLVVWVTGADPEIAPELVDAAELVLVHDPALVEPWRQRWPQANVDVLLPAAQPQVHHPALGGPGERREVRGVLVVDDGGLGERAAQAWDELVVPGLKPVKSADFDVWTLDGQPGGQPDGVRPKFRGGCDYRQWVEKSGRYRVLLDAGRANAGSTWSLLEAGAAQTPAVTLAEQHAALPSDIAEHVPAGADEKELRGELVGRIYQSELRDRDALRLHRAILAGHTYNDRVARILAGLGRTDEPMTRTVSAVAPTNRAHQIDNILETMGRQVYPDLELVLVLHGLSVDHAELEAKASDRGVKNLTIVNADSSLTLGACLNLGIDAAGGAYIAKIDDDNFYGVHYVTDLMAAFDYTDAGIVGKWAHFVWLRSSNAVVLRCPDAEHTYERRIQGGTMLIDGGLAREQRFSDIPRAVDSDFLDRAIADGVKIYSTDRFNFVSVRGTDHTSHTWKMTDTFFMSKIGRLAFFGDPRIHAEV